MLILSRYSSLLAAADPEFSPVIRFTLVGLTGPAKMCETTRNGIDIFSMESVCSMILQVTGLKTFIRNWPGKS
jgi:hypothetical protein